MTWTFVLNSLTTFDRYQTAAIAVHLPPISWKFILFFFSLPFCPLTGIGSDPHRKPMPNAIEWRTKALFIQGPGSGAQL